MANSKSKAAHRPQVSVSRQPEVKVVYVKNERPSRDFSQDFVDMLDRYDAGARAIYLRSVQDRKLGL